MSWDIDGVRITRVIEHVMPFPVDFFVEAMREDVAGRWYSFAQSHDSLHAPAFADSVQPVIDAGLVDTMQTDVALTGEVLLRSTPGHTPGHMSVWIGERCVITGDVLHHPIQCRHPEWTARGDADPAMARATRRALLTAAATTHALVLGTHFTGTADGRILSTDRGYRFVPQPWRLPTERGRRGRGRDSTTSTST